MVISFERKETLVLFVHIVGALFYILAPVALNLLVVGIWAYSSFVK